MGCETIRPSWATNNFWDDLKNLASAIENTGTTQDFEAQAAEQRSINKSWEHLVWLKQSKKRWAPRLGLCKWILLGIKQDKLQEGLERLGIIHSDLLHSEYHSALNKKSEFQVVDVVLENLSFSYALSWPGSVLSRMNKSLRRSITKETLLRSI